MTSELKPCPFCGHKYIIDQASGMQAARKRVACGQCGATVVSVKAWNCRAPAAANGAGRAINIIFDGPPGPHAGRFIEVETDDGNSIHIGEWFEYGGGMWRLRITALPPPPAADERAESEAGDV